MPVLSQPMIYGLTPLSGAALIASGRPAFRLESSGIDLPFSGLNFTLNYSGTSTLDATIPGLELLGDINSTGAVSLYYGTLLPDGSRIGERRILTVDITDLSYFSGVRSANFSLSASRAIPYGKGAGSLVARHVVSESASRGQRSLVCQYDPELTPGQTIVLPQASFRVGSIQHTAMNNGLMSVEELSATAEVARQSAEGSIPNLFRGTLTASDAAAGSVAG